MREWTRGELEEAVLVCASSWARANLSRVGGFSGLVGVVDRARRG